MLEPVCEFSEGGSVSFSQLSCADLKDFIMCDETIEYRPDEDQDFIRRYAEILLREKTHIA